MFDDVNWALVEFIAIGVFLVLLFIRNEIVFSARNKAGDLIASTPVIWREYLYIKVMCVDYMSLVFDLTKWKFHHFYPWLADIEALNTPEKVKPNVPQNHTRQACKDSY